MKISLKTLSKRTFPAVLGALVGLSATVPPADAAQFRRLPALPMIPPSITFPGERNILQADLDRLKARIKSHDAKRRDYRLECAQRQLSNAVRKRRCSSLAQEIHRDGSRLRTEIGALSNRFGTIEQNALQRRQSGVSPLGGAGRTRVSDKRPKLIADALSAAGRWSGVLAYVRTNMDRGAGDPAVRDVSAYLDGLNAGRVAADRLENGYYKHGVRRSLAADHWSAALAFAQAARDTPEDLRVFQSYADAAGRQHAAPACSMSGRCVSGNIAVWVKRFGRRHERLVKQLVAAGRKGALDPATMSVLNVLRAITVYAAKTEAGPETGAASRDMAAQALAAFGRGDRAVAIASYVRLWTITEPGRAQLFLQRYADASGSDAARRLMDDEAVPPGNAPIIDDAYLATLKEAFAAGEDANPFGGKLSQAQIIRLQR